ncbi:hypothetical protein GQ54DRAFT_298466 [Martensiomyces pterosporus]|nr:hypothetical protein GQ54DRAFT_298466 [Martensiomyces pterosporus]
MAFKRKHQPNAQLPAALASRISGEGADAAGEDDGRFSKRYKNTIRSRKQARKQARVEKKQRKNTSYKQAHGFAAPEKTTKSKGSNKQATAAAAAATAKAATGRREKNETTAATKSSSTAAAKKVGSASDDRARLMKFAKRNQGMYQLLRDSNLIENVDKEAGIKSKVDQAEEIEDRELRRLERNLGIKSSGKLAGAFFDEGLGDLLEGISYGSKDIRKDGKEPKKMEKSVSFSADDRDDGRDDGSEVSEGESSEGSQGDDAEESDEDAVGEDDAEGSEDDMFGLNDFGPEDEDSDSEDSDIAAMYKSQGIDVDSDGISGSDVAEQSDELDSDDGENTASEDNASSDASEEQGEDESSSEDDGDGETAPTSPEPKQAPAPAAPAVPSVGRYIPPSLRKKQSEDDERLAAIRKVLQGQLNRLSETNIEAIITQVEAQYQKYPRHHVTEVLSSLILQSIKSRIHMLDTFLYVNAALVGAIYRTAGLEPVAHLVQKLMEEFEKYFELGLAAFKAGEDKGASENGELSAGKECQNLSVFVAELYNFQVISCQLVYDVIRMCTRDINEFTAELLLKIIRISGVQLRKDDPLALKEIVNQVNETVGKAGAKKFSVRCQFMVESLTHLKDNRMRNTMSQNAENVAKLKKFLGNMDKRRSVMTTEPINIGLEDIHDIETKGKWWLVGSSWVGNQAGADEDSGSSASARQAIRKMQEASGSTEMDRLLKLAKEQHMNTDVRRSIFVTLLSSDDYADAFERLMKLDLKKTQIREVIRVLLHCCGQEKAYNPYYTLVAYKLCSYHNSYRLTLQYALWDFLREMGETDVGGLGRINSEEDHEAANVPLRRMVNVAKLYGWLIDKQALSLLVLKTVTFAKVGRQARVFFQVMFSTIFLQHKKQSEADVQSLHETFSKATANPTMCHGILFFFHHFVKDCELVKEDERPLMKWGCKLAKQVFRSSTENELYED